MNIMRALGISAFLAVPLALAPQSANAQVAVGIGIGPVVDYPAYDYVDAAPVCEYGYYGYYPYTCAPYGY